ncbi:MAG: magnesium-translocating P-type ATPase [Candidatus Aminicenantes bacterium RBG_16_63_16]|nr:MAG: magnesium-translocating P-type ATPase [Candidatus Aminicenantes bacterium RBG_16_63_16]
MDGAEAAEGQRPLLGPTIGDRPGHQGCSESRPEERGGQGAGRANVLYMGTHIVSGSGLAVVVLTGKGTEFGRVAERLKVRPLETEFERGIRRFGYLLMEVTLVMLFAIFAANVFLRRPFFDSFLFSLALAVGLTPQLLPAIISVNLSHGAKNMARHKVIVKRLASIENFGSMGVLCSDKTGTLTEGVVHIHSALDIEGHPSDRVMFYAYINACHETGFQNPVDAALRNGPAMDISAYVKLDEVPYDFVRKRLSILVSHEGRSLMITKGALANVLEVCSGTESADGSRLELAQTRAKVTERYETFSRRGYRVLGVAGRDLAGASGIAKDAERDMTLAGLLVLHDPPKEGVADAVAELRRLGVALKVITGDNALVAADLAAKVGLESSRILAGPELGRMSDEALMRRSRSVDIFAAVEPNQKERIINSLKKSGHVVGFIGDGINDAAALHAADVGISVDSAVDVAKEAADIVLLEKGLDVLAGGVREGRRTFANTLKYVFMATSANFGNMFSMAGASLFLPFLPMLPKQILLTNLLTDFPEMTIATDSVDPETLERPRRWDIRFIRKFMMVFGPLSSVLDFLTFGVLLLLLRASDVTFRTGWFMESVVSAALIVLVVRTRRPFFKSRPARSLVITTLAIVAAAVSLPFTPLGSIFGFAPLPVRFFAWMAGIVALYIVLAEVTKKVFYRKVTIQR